MNFAASLTATEIDILGNADRTLSDTTRAFKLIPAVINEESFDKALRVKQTVDFFEAIASQEPNKKVLAVLINGESQLWELYKDIPLRHNPFLSHWVEAIQRLDALQVERKLVPNGHADISKEKITVARALWIKTLMRAIDEQAGIDLNVSPMDISHTLVRDGLHPVFDLRPYIRILEQEGIYEARPIPDGAEDTSSVAPLSEDKDNRPHAASNHVRREDSHESFQQWKEKVPQKLQDDPNQAIFELTHLPIEISSLDYLTTLLTDRTLEKHSIDPDLVVTQYIQHALRTVERMEKAPASTPDEFETSQVGLPMEFKSELEYGKEAQSRAVRLLLLFMKSLIRKGLVSMEILYFEIQEICVRYVWIKEVREFRTWIEDGLNEPGA